MPRPVPFGVSRVSRVRISISVTVQSSVSAVCWKSNKMPKVQLISHISLVLNVEWITRHNTLAFHNVRKVTASSVHVMRHVSHRFNPKQ